jgi:hypothetical protein
MVDAYFFDPIFDDGVVNEQRIETAAVRIQKLAQTDEAEARKAGRLLQNI